MIRTRLLGRHQLAALAEGWERCRTEATHPQMAHRLDLLLRWTPGDVQAVVAENATRLVGVAPLARRVRRHSWEVRLPSSRRAVASFDLDTVEVLGEGFAAADDPDLTRALMGGVLDAAADADLVRLQRIRQGSTLAGQVGRASVGGGWICVPSHGTDFRHRTPLEPSAGEYLARHFVRKSRRSLLQDVGRIDRHPSGSTVTVFSSPTDVGELLRRVAQVEARTWQIRRGARRLGCNPATRERLEAWAALGLVRAYVLAIGGEPAAFVVAYASDGCLWVAKMGFSDAWSHRSPGKVLLWKVIEDLHRDGSFTAIDLGPGQWTFKTHFAPAGYPVRSASLFPVKARPLVALAPSLLWERARAEAVRSLVQLQGEGSRTQAWVRRNLSH